jgi:hypothetical protein
MSGRPAIFRQRDAKQLISAAKACGLKQIDFKVGDSTATVYLTDPPEAQPLIGSGDVNCGDPNNSFDKILAPTP